MQSKHHERMTEELAEANGKLQAAQQKSQEKAGLAQQAKAATEAARQTLNNVVNAEMAQQAACDAKAREASRPWPRRRRPSKPPRHGTSARRTRRPRPSRARRDADLDRIADQASAERGRTAAIAQETAAIAQGRSRCAAGGE